MVRAPESRRADVRLAGRDEGRHAAEAALVSTDEPRYEPERLRAPTIRTARVSRNPARAPHLTRLTVRRAAAYFLRNLSTRPAVSTIFCLPV